MDDATLRTALRWFPLIGRPRPACPSLPERVGEITGITRAACQPSADVLAEAPHALNKAALLASDCGLADLARDLCWQHINIYRQFAPLTVPLARAMLEPVLNLARLRIRAKAHGEALHLLGDIYQAVTAGTDLTIDGQALPLAGLTGSRDQHRKLREWVWLQYLSEGIRVHALAGRWDEAVAHAEAHRGIGAHLLEGRQAAIISCCLSGRRPAARRMLGETTVTEPWERHVAVCLNVITADDTPDPGAATAMTQRFLRDEPAAGYIVFRTRLGLTMASLASTNPAAAAHVTAKVAAEAIQSRDGYAARDILQDPAALPALDNRRRDDLTRLVTGSGIGAGALPAELLHSLTESVTSAATTLAASGLLANHRVQH